MYPRVPPNGKPSNIGSQFANVGTFVLIPGSTKPVIRGAPGELCVAGPLVAKGYLNRPQLTSERFQTLPSGERVYRTGDIVRMNHDGSFNFLGRADDQVKLRGQRLEIGEIDTVIKQSHTTISDASSLVTKHHLQQKEQLISFIVLEGFVDPRSDAVILADMSAEREVDAALTAAREACQTSLPGYMVPTHFLPISSIPLSANNKADAKRLKQLFNEITLDGIQALSDQMHKSGENEMTQDEQKIADLISEISPHDGGRINRVSSIFELGLDSISVIAFSSALREKGFKGAHPSLVMRNPRIGTLAKALSMNSSSPTDANNSLRAAKQSIWACENRYRLFAAKSLQTEPDGVDFVAPCTALQEGIISRTLKNEKPIYYAEFRFDLEQNVDLNRLRLACERVLANAQILRTRFVLTENGFVQAALRSAKLSWYEESARHESAATILLKRAHVKWFMQDVGKFVSPFEVFLVRLPDRTVMALHIFHALYDGNSFPMLLRCITQEYHGKARVDYGIPFYEALAHGPLRQAAGAKHFWTRHLAGIRTTTLRSLATEDVAHDTIFTSTVSCLPKLEYVRCTLSTTHQALIQACWTVVLHHFFHGPVTVGVVVSGRSIDFEGAESVIGPLFNTVPFHLRLSKRDSWDQIVKKCHDFNAEAIPYQHTSLRDIQKWCKIG